MLPGASPERIRREVTKGSPSGRTHEIQRLIGRSLRGVCDMVALGERQVVVDCDVLQADGGTRTASITGGYLALHDALTRLVQAGVIGTHPLTEACAAISVGIVDGTPGPRPALRRGLRRRGRHERRHDRERPVPRGAGHRRGHELQPRRARRHARRSPRAASPSSSSCRSCCSPTRPSPAAPAAEPVRLVVASANPDKVAEIAAILEPAGVELEPRPASVPDVVEDADTLEGNARLKAVAIADAVGAAGRRRRHRPRGRRPRRRAGRALGPLRRRGRDLRRQRGQAARRARPGRGRHARSSAGPGSAPSPWCAGPTASELAVEGIVEGHIALEAAGERGFGYDPVFVPDEGGGRTFAEMSAAEKHAISHRGRAFRALADGSRPRVATDSGRARVKYPCGYPTAGPVTQEDVSQMQFPEEVIADVRTRLRRVAGQVQGIERMLEEGRECRDIVTQLSAANRALEQAGFRLVAAGPHLLHRGPRPGRRAGLPAGRGREDVHEAGLSRAGRRRRRRADWPGERRPPAAAAALPPLPPPPPLPPAPRRLRAPAGHRLGRRRHLLGPPALPRRRRRRERRAARHRRHRHRQRRATAASASSASGPSPSACSAAGSASSAGRSWPPTARASAAWPRTSASRSAGSTWPGACSAASVAIVVSVVGGVVWRVVTGDDAPSNGDFLPEHPGRGRRPRPVGAHRRAHADRRGAVLPRPHAAGDRPPLEPHRSPSWCRRSCSAASTSSGGSGIAHGLFIVGRHRQLRRRVRPAGRAGRRAARARRSSPTRA